ncbi:MAG TPA: enoyl-CoA hydratase/isomerase family protein, partial [Phenylobacterium sp.]
MADLELRQEGEVVWATMNRPERLNALSRPLVTALREFFVDLYWRRDVRVVVLQGAGNAFCAGLDLKERGDNSGAERSIGAGLTRQ